MGIPRTLAGAKKELKSKISRMNRRNPLIETFAILVNGIFAGYVEIHDLSYGFVKHRAAIGYCVDPQFRGQGVATRAVQLAVPYAFKKYHLKRLTGTCRTFNKASARVLEKSGFKLEGILRKNKFKDGKYLDDMVWAKVC